MLKENMGYFKPALGTICYSKVATLASAVTGNVRAVTHKIRLEKDERLSFVVFVYVVVLFSTFS
jgi:hypothetical protein